MSAIKKKNFFVIGTLLENRSQEVVPVILLQPGTHWRSGIKPSGMSRYELVLVRDRSRDIHHRQEHKDICLQQRNKDVQPHTDRGNQEISQTQKHHSDLLA